MYAQVRNGSSNTNTSSPWFVRGFSKIHKVRAVWGAAMQAVNMLGCTIKYTKCASEHVNTFEPL